MVVNQKVNADHINLKSPQGLENILGLGGSSLVRHIEDTSDLAGHVIINPFGKRISLTLSTFLFLRKSKYLYRDKLSGLFYMDHLRFLTFLSVEEGNDYFLELGPDCSGLQYLVCNCNECRPDRIPKP